VIQLDVLGRAVAASPSAVAQLRDLAAARAGLSSSQRDLSLVLDRALRTRTTVVLQRGEARALLELAEAQPGNAEMVALANATRRAL
jgi:hypothetical protein